MSELTFRVELALALVGPVVGWGRHRREVSLLAMVTLSHALGYSLFQAKLRYRIAILPLVFMLAAVGAVALSARIAEHVSRTGILERWGSRRQRASV